MITIIYVNLFLCITVLCVIIWTIVAIGTYLRFNPLKKCRTLFVGSQKIKVQSCIECAGCFIDCIVWIKSAIHLHYGEMKMNGV